MPNGKKLSQLNTAGLAATIMTALAAGVATYCLVTWLWFMKDGGTKKAQEVANTMAVLLGAGYFAIRYFSGEFWSRLELTVKTERSPVSPSLNQDHLLITVSGINQGITSLRLVKGIARIRGIEADETDKPFEKVVPLGEEFRRYSIGPDLTLSPAGSSLRINPKDWF